MSVTLYGYQYSVYTWIARFALHEKGTPYERIEVNPFAEDVDQSYRALHPFMRVPTLVHDDFTLYETNAITRYINDAFDGPALQPKSAKDRARLSQVISIVDNYTYWPLVRQVFAHGVMGPRIGRPSDPAEVKRGLEAAPRVLRALNALAERQPFLLGDSISLADIHLAPMIAYFNEAEDGQALVASHENLAQWWVNISGRSAFIATTPQLPESAT